MIRSVTRGGWRRAAVRAATLTVAILGMAGPAPAQTPAAGELTRAGIIAAEQQKKAADLKPYVRSKAEVIVKEIEDAFLTGNLHWHPFFQSAYQGGGFTLGAGYARHVSDYSTLDVRGSWTFKNYKRLEAEFFAPRLFNRRATLSILGGWREATQVGFYGFGTPNTSHDDRVNWGFDQPYGSAYLEMRPTRRVLVLGAGAEYSQWNQGPGEGTAPSIETVYTPETLPGLGSNPKYLRATGAVAIDWRPSPGYATRGGSYGVTFNDHMDTDDRFGFYQTDYEVIQHLPLGRDFWVLSVHGVVSTTDLKDDQVIPFYMLPALGGGRTLRGFTSWRFRDRHSILLQGELRAILNPFLDMALFYDAGKVTSSRSDLDLEGLKKDYGLGFRLHSPFATPLRIEVAKSNEGLSIIFSSSAVF